MRLYGRDLGRSEVEALSGSASQFAGVRAMTLDDGLERGIRMLEFRTGTGLRFTVLIDRALDIADCELNGMALGWHSPSGFRHPGLADVAGEDGLGWLRAFSGLLVTCGLDHTLFMYEADTSDYHYRARPTAKHSIHGKVATLPARLTGYGERWEGDRCVLWCEGVVRQAAVFGEDLELTRRIEIDAGTNDIRLTDVVRNRGYYRTPHMFLYHINVGYPVLAEGSRYLAPISDVVWAGHGGKDYAARGIGYRTMAAPQDDFHEQVWEHEMAANEDGKVSVALVNDALRFGIEIETVKDQFPCHYEWQNLQKGQYALGLEPSTHHVTGEGDARQRGEMIFLRHDDECRYDTTIRILAGADAIADCERRITAACAQPDEDFPEPSGSFPKLAGRFRSDP